MRHPALLFAIPLLLPALEGPAPGTTQEPDSSLVDACRNRVELLANDPANPRFALSTLCGGRVVAVHPEGHDLQLYEATLGGSSTKKLDLQYAFERVFRWLDADYMLPAEPEARNAVLEREAAAGPLVLLVLSRVKERDLFNHRYGGGAILEDVVACWLEPSGHEWCEGVPNAYPGSCGDNRTCAWEFHVPLCELVNRGTARLLERRFGPLPPALQAFAEIVELDVAGGHYSYRHFSNEAALLHPDDRDGYAIEFRAVLKRRYTKKRDRRPYLEEVLGWTGGSYSPEQYAAGWGLCQALLAHGKVSGKGREARTLGSLLAEIGAMEAPDAGALYEVLTAYDPGFPQTFTKSVPKRLLRSGALLFDQ